MHRHRLLWGDLWHTGPYRPQWRIRDLYSTNIDVHVISVCVLLVGCPLVTLTCGLWANFWTDMVHYWYWGTFGHAKILWKFHHNGDIGAETYCLKLLQIHFDGRNVLRLSAILLGLHVDNICIIWKSSRNVDQRLYRCGHPMSLKVEEWFSINVIALFFTAAV